MLAPGAIFDQRYEILSQVGEGGMGAVYKAKQLDGDRIVALKLLHSGLFSDAENQVRFQREAKILYELVHPNLPIFYHIGKCDETLYMAMEFLEGSSLRGVLLKDSRLSPARCVHIAVQICNALQVAHNLGVIHRDVKPENIFLLNSPDPDFVKVVDFGLARVEPDSAAEAQKLTHTGLLIGSIHYMSPEQCTGKKADPRSDVYALGCMMYEALSGMPPFDSDNPIGMLHKHLTEKPDMDRIEQATGENSGWTTILQKAMAKAPDDRYQSAEDLKNALLTLNEQRSDVAPLANKSPKRNTLVLLGLATAIVLITAAVLKVIDNRSKSRQQTTVNAADNQVLLKKGRTLLVQDQPGESVVILKQLLNQQNSQTPINQMEVCRALDLFLLAAARSHMSFQDGLVVLLKFQDKTPKSNTLSLAACALAKAKLLHYLHNQTMATSEAKRAIDFAGAENHLTESRLDIKNQAQYIIGCIHVENHHYKDALNVFQEVLSQDTSNNLNDDFYRSLAEAYFKDNRLDDSVHAFNTIKSKEKGGFETSAQKWTCQLLENHEYERAIKVSKSTLAALKDSELLSPVFLNYLAQCYWTLGNRQEALETSLRSERALHRQISKAKSEDELNELKNQLQITKQTIAWIRNLDTSVAHFRDDPTNLVKNGSFEAAPELDSFVTLYAGSPDLAHWQILKGGVDLAGKNYWKPMRSNHCIDLDGAAAGGIRQVITTEPGQKYKLTFLLSANHIATSTPNIKAFSVWTGKEESKYSFDATELNIGTEPAWRTESKIFVAPTATTGIAFMSTDDPSSKEGAVIDEVRVEPVK